MSAPAAEIPSGERPQRPRSPVALIVLAVLAVAFTLWAAQDLVLPVLLSMFLALVGNPIIRLLQRLYLPRFIGALLVLVLGIAGSVLLARQLAQPAGEWIREVPREFSQLAPKLRSLVKPVQDANKAAENIARAAAYLDGTVLAPGEVWSFNRTVGPRTLERGFVDAPVIVQDELEPGVGGGVCQVATTLFAAGVMGGLDVVKRRSHSRPSGYAPLGLDATVIDGEVDLQLRNPYPVPIIVHAFLPVPTRIRVEMLGISAPGKIEHSYAVTKSEDFYRRVAKHPELRPDQVKRHQRGIPGYDVVSTVRTRYVDGSQRVRHYSSTYYPVPEVYWVGAEVDPESLPALPERATHTEIKDDDATTAPASFTEP